MNKLTLALIAALLSNITFADQTEDPSVACVRAIENRPEVKVLQSKMTVISDRAPSLEMLSNNQKPTKTEKTAISALDSLLSECTEQGRNWRQRNYHPQMAALANQYAIDLRSLLADLYASKITYGAFLKGREALEAKLVSDATDLGQRLRAARQQADDNERQRREQQARDDQLRQAQDDQARRNLAAQLLMNQRPYQLQTPQPIPYQPARSTSTQCNPNGIGGFNCTSN